MRGFGRRMAGVAVLAATLQIAPSPAAPGVRSDLLVSTTWLAEHLADPGLVVVHVARDKAQYLAGHIPAARFLPWSAVATTRDGVENEFPSSEELAREFANSGVGEARRIVLYDEAGGVQAARAFVALDYLGQGHRTALLDGGLTVWRLEGRPLSTYEAKPEPAAFAPRVEEGVIAGFQAVASASSDACRPGACPAKLVDARPPEQYSGREAGEKIDRPGHIPGAVNVPAADNLVSPSRPLLKPAAELLRLYRAAGVKPGDEVITYCRTGGQASLAYFVLRYLGFKVGLFDGSYMEWSRDPARPVDRPEGGSAAVGCDPLPSAGCGRGCGS